VFEELESRLLMSADLNPLKNESLLAAPALQGAEFRALADDVSAVTRTAVSAVQVSAEIVIVDPRVPDRAQLLAGLTAQSDGRRFEVIELDPRRDGIAQVTEALRGRIQLDAVHFITHGADGAVQLGGTWLDAKALAANADAVAGWGDSLKQDADLLFYGCDLASSASGRALMGWIAELTRGDVAASADATGAAAQGGDWELEANVGAIETRVAVAAEARAAWAHVLGATATGPQAQANVTAGAAQAEPAVATAPDGRYVLAWSGNGPGDTDGVFMRLYAASGAPQTGEIRVNTTAANSQSAPAVAMDGAGNFVVVWSGNGTGDGTGVFARRFDAAGNPLDVIEFRVNGAVLGTQSSPDVAMEANGDFAVVWQSDETGTTEIWLQRYAADGTALPGPTLVSTAGGNNDLGASIAMDDDGDLVVTWQSQDANNAGVFARRYDNTGAAQGGIFQVNATSPGEQQRPDVAMDGVGNFVVAWDGEGATDNKGLYARRYDAGGNALTGDFRANGNTSNDQTSAAVAMSAAGRFVVTWESKNQDGSSLGVYGQEYNVAGGADGSEFRVNTYTNNDQMAPAVAMDDAGSYVVAWSGEGATDPDGVYWRRYVAPSAGTITGTVFHDLDGDGDLAGATTFAGATVRLYMDDGDGVIEATDGLLLTTTTDPSGVYTFNGMPLATYYVVVDSRTLTLGPATVWAEQTYGVAGSALGAGFSGMTGAHYGGRSAAVSDDASALLTAEHVTKVTLAGAGGAGNVDFGFSFNAVTSERDGDDDPNPDRSVQGSLRQFIQNANVTAGVQAADFSIGGGGLQTINVAAAMPGIVDAVVIDGGTQEGYAGTPLIVLNGASAGAASGLALQAGSGGSTIRALAINRFSGSGIVVAQGSDGNRVLGNYIGTDAAGAAVQGNGAYGIDVAGSGNTIGGTGAGAANVISGNFAGVQITGANATGNRVQGNFIGTDRTGASDLGNITDGVRIASGATGNTIGGAAPGEGNLISGNNGDGVELNASSGNIVQGNRIGTTADGVLSRNNSGSGVLVTAGAMNNTIGGTALGAGNTIAFNSQDGVTVSGAGSGGNAILGNAIRQNTQLGIDLVGGAGETPAGVTPNDAAGDIDAGANGLQNAPQLYAAGLVGGNLNIQFAFASTALSTYRVELFASSAPDASGFGEGQRYLGSFIVTTDAAGSATSSNFWLPAAGVAPGEFVTATATVDLGGGNYGNTSEFSNAVVANDRTISGTIFHDVNGDAAVSGAEGTFSGAIVELYIDDGDGAIDAGDLLYAAVATDAAGLYSFAGLGNATYWVVVDSKSIGGPNVWAEQTYGDDSATALLDLGVRYGGRNAVVSDDATTLATAEHVSRVNLAGSDVAGVDSGFSFVAIVNRRGDDADDDPFNARQQQGTLRQFILNGNVLIDAQTANFSIAGAGVQTIDVTGAALPTIIDKVTLDAWTQGASGYTGPPLIELNGAGAGAGADGFLLAPTAGGSMVRGFVINRFSGDGVHVEADNTIISGNYIGTDATGAAAAGNASWGVHLLSSFNRVGGTGTGERNVISGNALDGIRIDAPGTGNVIIGNHVGVDVAGANAIANGGSGVWLNGSSGNTIGGASNAARNVISGNTVDGITGIGSSSNLIQGNYIGTNAAGTLALGNGEDGVYLEDGSSNTVGGTVAAARNVISGNNWSGITFWGTGAGNVAQGNYIGTDLTGTNPLGNLEQGILVATAGPTTIGGTAPGEGNRIAFNGWDGVEIRSGTGHTVLGNVIYANAEQSIDINDDGVTFNDAGDGDAGTNELQNFPVLFGAAISGPTVTISGTLESVASTNYRIEFFADGVGGPRFLGALSPNLFIGAAGSATFVASLTTPVAAGETITATATNLATGSTSELSGPVTATAGFAISGTLFHDVNGNAVVTDDGASAVFANTANAVALYLDDGDLVVDSGDSFISAVSTNASGGYTFGGLASGTYYVVVNSRALGAATYTSGFGLTDVWAEQTYGTLGSALGAGFTGASGVLYGGRNVALSDNALGSINTAEHVTRVTLAGGNVGDVNSGFSFNAIVNNRGNNADDDTSNARRQQGTLRQFILNANAIDGAQAANFSINYPGGGAATINVTGAALPTITQAVILDAVTQEGVFAAGAARIALAGPGAFDGLTITGGGSTVRGFVINGFDRAIFLSGGGGNTIAGNYLGTNLAGNAGVGNQYGIWVDSSNNLVGGTTAADRNVISGNSIDGAVLRGNDNTIAGNYIGTDATGTFAIGNGEDGVWLYGGSGNRVGGTSAAARNVIAANGWAGVAASNLGSDHVIQGNWIGLNASGAALGNAEEGVRIYDGTDVTVGGTAPGAGNVIAHNGTAGLYAGVAVDSGAGHSVLGNSIYANSGLGIDVAFDGAVTPNDAPDANGWQNFPVLTTAATAAGTITISGTLSSTPSSTYRIEFFASPVPGDASGYGEGERYLGAMTVSTDISGNASFASPAFTAGVALGERITATATDLAFGDTSEFSAQVAATPPNTAPVANDVTVNGSEDASSIAVALAGSDAEGPIASFRLTSLPANGTLFTDAALTLAATVGPNYPGNTLTLYFRPDANWYGSTAFQFTATDAGGLDDATPATVTINVLPANDPPVANADGATVAEDSGANTIDVLLNDSILPDIGETLVITGVTQGANGTVAILGGGTAVSYTPNGNFFGVDSFTYTISDGNGGTATAAVNVNVSPANDPPVTSDDSATVGEDSGASPIDVLLNDSFAPDVGETLTITGVTQGASGTVSITGGGTGVTYTPNANFFGADSFTYTISDGNGATAIATVNVNVTPANDLPVANADSATVAEDSGANTIDVLANDSILPDVGETLTVTGVTQGANGTVAILGGGTAVTYTPNTSFAGADSFTYTISDGNGGTATSTVNVNVTSANDPPTANNDSATVAEDSGASTIDVLVNDLIAPDVGETLAIIGITQGANGTVAITGGGTAVSYTPNGNFFGADSFTYTISDGNGGTATATVSVTVMPENDPPQAIGDLASIAEDSGASTIDVLLNDSIAPDVGETLAITGMTQGANGTVAITGGGTTVTYTPNANFVGADSFTYTIDDGNGGTATAIVSVNVTPTNDRPVANDDAATVAEDSGASTIDVLLNDSILPDAAETLTVTGVTQGANGTVAIIGGGTAVTYTPSADFFGADSFAYTISDGNGGTATATVSVTVTPADDLPVANADAYAALEDTPLAFGAPGVLANDAGLGDGPLVLTVVGAPVGGSVVLNNDGSFTFTPTPNFTGAASFQYQVQDADGDTVLGDVAITVSAVNDAPVLDLDANDSSGALGAGYVRTFTEGGLPARVADLDASLTDLDSPTLAAVTVTITNLLDGAAEVLAANVGATGIVANYAGGVLTLSGGANVADYEQVLRTVTYENTSDAPNPTERIITVVADDGINSSNVGTTRMTVNPVNDAPDATIAAASYAATENMTLALHGTGLAVADVDALPTSIVMVQVGATSGLLSATASNGTTIAGGGSPTLTLTGTPAQINAVLDGTAGTVTYLVGSDSPFPTDTLSLAISDNGASGAGGALWDWESVTVNLTAVNDAPIITIPGTASTPEDTALVFSAAGGNQISITEVDAGGAPVAVTLNVSNGLVTLAGVAGLTFTTGDGTADASMAFTGTVAAINAALNGLSFAPPAEFNGPAFLSLSVDDQGNSGSGGALTDADFTTITVTGVNDAPAGANSTVATPQDTPYVLSAADFGFTDGDAGDTLAAVRMDALPGAGTLTLSGSALTVGQIVAVADINLGNLVFTPALGAAGVPYASFAFSVQDSGGAFDASPNTLTVNVATPVNNAPSGTNGVVTTAVSTDYVFTLANFGYSDPDAGDAFGALRIDTLPSLLVGTLYFGALPFTPGMEGTVVSAAGVAAGNLYFRPLPLLPGSASFDFSVRDTNGPAFDVAPNTMTVNIVVPANDPVNIVPGAATANEDTATAIGGIAVNDPNGDLASVQLGVANGTLGATAAGAAVVAGAGTSALTITGSQLEINATLASLTYLGNSNFAGADTLTITSTDAALLADTDTVAITVDPVNDAPTASAPAAYAATEQVMLALTSLAVGDVDAGGNSVTVTLSAVTGAILVGGGAGVTVSGSGTPFVTLTGSVGNINAVLAGAINYLVTTDSPPATDTLTLTIDDGGASGSGGPRSASATATIAIAATNDAPVNTLPGGATTLEDTGVVYSAALGNQISITDVDAGGAPLQVSLAASNGVVTLGGVAGLTFTASDGTADASMTFTGTVASINAALDGLVFTPNPDYNGLAFIQLTTNDLGASGSAVPVAPGSDTDLATIDVLPVNDAPDGTDTTVTVNEDSTYTFTGANFGFNDVDFGDAMTEVRIDSVSVPAGASLMLGVVPLAAGTVIPAASIGTLVFTPPPDANGAGYASFTFSVRDTGVPPGPLYDLVPNTMTINVAPVNDLPVITSGGGLAAVALTVVENTTGVTTVTATDIDVQLLTFSIAGGLDAARFSIDATSGVLTFDPAPNFEAPADSGTNNVYDVVIQVADGAGGSDTQALSITVTDANDAPFVTGDAYTTVEDAPLSVAAAGVLANDGDEDLNPITATLVAGPANGSVAFNADGSFVYTPNANFAGVDSFTYHVSDGALVSGDATVTIAVSPVNDAPAAANGAVLSTPTVAYTFTPADFNYLDVDGDPLDHVRITALPTVGSLTLGGVAVALNQIVAAADVAAGSLQYVAPSGTTAADSFGYLVHDGTVYAGAGATMTVGFIVPPAPPPAPGPVAGPPPAPPAPPAPPPAPEPGGGTAPGAGTPPPATGGSHGGGGGGAAGTAPTPTFAENAPAAAESVAAAATAVTAAPIAALAGPSTGVSASSGGLQTDPRSLGAVEALQSRGELPEAEVKAAMQEIAVMRDQEFRQELNKLREEVQHEAVVETRVAASVFAVSTGLSVGYVLWLLRGGVLLASLLTSIPAWRLLDPLPVLGRVGGQSDEDDESLEEMVDNQPDRAAAGTDDETPAPRGAMRVLQAFRRSAT
jgi:hypothetical protein